MATAQINARIDASVKEAGDRALSQIGYTPTKAIRRLWEFAGAHLHDSSALRDLFTLLESNDDPSDAQAQAALLEERILSGPLIFEQALSELGISQGRDFGLSDEELLEQAYLEKMTERGTLL